MFNKIKVSGSFQVSLVLLIIFNCLMTGLTVYSQQNNALIPGDFADPSIIKTKQAFYATGTSSEWAPHFPIFQSTDMKTWKQTGYVFDKTPAWAASSFWAPEYYFHNNTYFVYYVAKRKIDGISCMGVASSKYPDRDFLDHGVILEYGKEAIDPFVFDDHGQLYITWKAYGLDGRPIEILGSKLSADGLSLTGEPFSMLKDEPHIGLEGQSILYRDSYYYLFYSAGNCCGIKCDYNVRVARSKNIQGPYELDPANPVLKNDAFWKCTGHGTFVNVGGRDYYLYHGYNVQSNVFTGRQGLMSELVWPSKNSWPVFKTTLSSGAKLSKKSVGNIADRFTSATLSAVWQWDFRNATPVAMQGKDGLHLSGMAKPTNLSGTVLTVRPYSANYEISTSVTNHNNALKGLVIYGDANAAIGIGTVGDKVEYWMIKDNKRTLLGSEQIVDAAKPVDLKIGVSPDFTCQAYWKQAGDWRAIATDNALKIDFLPQWDRSPRPGLNFKGDSSEDAVFSFFNLEYKD